MPKELVNGQSFEFSLKFINQSDVSFDNLQIKVDYPSGFNFKSSEPQSLEGDNVWSVGRIDAGEEIEIFINGDISGSEGDSKPFQAQAGILDDNQFTLYSESISALKISSSPLLVIQTVNDSSSYIANSGEKLKYQIDYKSPGLFSIVLAYLLVVQSIQLSQARIHTLSQLSFLSFFGLSFLFPSFYCSFC